MTPDALRALAEAKPGTSHVVQWGGSDVWKVGGKVFVVAREDAGFYTCSFKVTPMAFEVLPDEAGLRPAPYLASRGMKWIQLYGPSSLTEDEIEAYILQSYDIVASGLTKKLQRELGLL